MKERITAEQWKIMEVKRLMEAERAKRQWEEMARAKILIESEKIVDQFMELLVNNNPWETNSKLLVCTAKERDAIDLAVKVIIDHGFKAVVEHPTNVGPGGCGKMEERWTSELWGLYVYRPQ